MSLFVAELPKLGPLDSIVSRVEDLPDVSSWRRCCYDVETVSFRDDEKALDPFRGHRIAGIAVSEPVSDRAWYVPIRHRGAHNDGLNLPLEPVQLWLRDLFGDPTREITAHNAKFDLRFTRHEPGVEIKAVIADTMALARLVHNYTPRLNLEYLCQLYGVPGKADVEVKRWLKAAKSDDYGLCPVRIMAPYAMQDVRSTRGLRRVLEKKLPEFSRGLWENEKRFTSVLFELEWDGVPIDRSLLITEWRDVVERLIEIQSRLEEIAGWKIDPSNQKHKLELLFDQFKLKPVAYTTTGRVRLNKVDFDTMPIPEDADAHVKEALQLFRAWNYLQHMASTYMEGWIKRMDVNDRLHTDMKQAYVVTGRLSSSNPNIQNIPFEAERYIVAPPGHAIVSFDFSQVEYRVFGHYTKDPEIVRAYLENPDADFHQFLADQLGVQRQFAKMLNFAFLYGMGKNKLIHELMAVLSIMKGEDLTKALGQLTMFMRMTGESGAKSSEAFIKDKDDEHLREAAEAIYDLYHKKFPSIGRFQRDVQAVAKSRGYVKNMSGRRYVFDVSDFDLSDYEKQDAARKFGPHRAVNYIVQGTCADMLRYCLVKQHETLRPKYGSQLIMTVHDSVFWVVRRELAPEFFVEAKALLEDHPRITVPIRADGKVATSHVDADVDIDESRSKPRGAAVKKKKNPADPDGWAWCTGGAKVTADDVREALALADRATHKSLSPLEISKGYRTGRH